MRQAVADAMACAAIGLLATDATRHLGAFLLLLAIFLELRSLRPK